MSSAHVARPMRAALAFITASFAGNIAMMPSCTPIGVPASTAPINRCSDHPCDGYPKENTLAARCSTDTRRCEFQARPNYDFWIVIHVPDTALSSPGSTFVFFSGPNGEPAFQDRAPTDTPSCQSNGPVPCLKIGNLGIVTGQYRVTKEESTKVGFPLEDNTSIPVRVVYTPTGNGNVQSPSFDATLPFDLLFDSSTIVTDDQGTAIKNVRALPFGTYQRVFYPQPPFDEFFPPRLDSRTVAANLSDDFLLGPTNPQQNQAPLDDTSEDKRLANVSREDGLDGFRVWLEDSTTDRRISVIRKLSGKEAEVQLYTTGENRSESGASLAESVQVVVAPPSDWVAVPRYVSPLFGVGAGLRTLRYPAIPPPVRVTGVVAFTRPEEGPTLRGIPSTITFESRGEGLFTRTDDSPLLEYQTTVNTDDRGLFATILPPGNYIATVEPSPGTGFAKSRQGVTIESDTTGKALTFKPPPTTVVRGKVVLTDKRPVGEAEVIATPDVPIPRDVITPRPNRTKTEADGRYVLDLDPGPYIFTVVPKGGTGFPRITTRSTIPVESTELPDISIPPPTKLSLVFKDPSFTENAVANAVVRIFANPSGRENRPIEIGTGMTSADGSVEILLAQQPR